ncbi:MAG: amidophosphoribosyltransferase [Bacteroidales bacterium]
MTDDVKHKCGIALLRLKKPLEYYQMKYGSWRYGLRKLYLLMEKQRNRGQDGAGVVSMKYDMPPGYKYFSRQRSMDASAINIVFDKIYKPFKKLEKKNSKLLNDVNWLKLNQPFVAETYLGHLRYGTFGNNNIDNVHPVMRQNNWKSRNLVLAGNFNLTNVDELFQTLVNLGQSPKEYSDTVTILEKVGHFLDRENERLFRDYKDEGHDNTEISNLIAENMDIAGVLRDAAKRWDGGFVIAGMIGHGDSFVLRDPWGIRPAYYYDDEEVTVVTSERPVIQTAMNVTYDKVKEVPPGFATILRKNGSFSVEQVLDKKERKSCSFERIYFSRGSDIDIYNERKKLGELIVPAVLKSVNNDLANSVFSFIPNTAESAFYGMIKGVEDYMIELKTRIIQERGCEITQDELHAIISERPRVDKVAIKDLKLRTFIAQDKGRDDLVGHVYDITYGTVKRGVDNLIVIDDSIVRGTTLKQSIIRILDRLGPKKIVVVSSSPQIRYPDCYGIDMAKLGDFIAFKAAIALLRERGMEKIINHVYNNCCAQKDLPKEEYVNHVKAIYEPFTAEEISGKISELITGQDINAEVEVVYQSIENLHKACPNDLGDWYFTGDYPTPGGNKVVSTSFMNFIEGKDTRAY